MPTPEREDYNWNDRERIYSAPDGPREEPTPEQALRTELRSEDLRDGLGALILEGRYPTANEMLELVEVTSRFGIREMTVGIYPGENLRMDEIIRHLLVGMRDQYPNVNPTVLCLATEESLRWFKTCRDLHPGLKALAFMGTSRSRMEVEGWTEEFVLSRLERLIKELAYDGTYVIGGSENTTQAHPDFLRRLIQVEVRSGASTFCIADTIGTSRPKGVRSIVWFTQGVLHDLGTNNIEVEFHGHEDMGNGTANAIAAIAAGSRIIHVVTRGYGERAGNVSSEGVLLNLAAIINRREPLPWNTQYMTQLQDVYSRITGYAPPNQGPLGKNAFQTQVGIHAAAMFQAEKQAQIAAENGDHAKAQELARRARTIYSGPDPDEWGRKVDIFIGPLSGKSNVLHVFEEMGGDPTQLPKAVIRNVLDAATERRRVLNPEELDYLLGPYVKNRR